MNARYYDPSIGTFVSPDTIVPDAGRVFGYNRTMYSFGNPMKFVDPSGHDPCDNGSKNCDPLWLEYTQGLAQSGCGVGNCGISFSNYMAAQEQYQAYLANEGQYDADLGIINGDLPGDAQAAGQRNQYYEVYKQYFLPSHLAMGTDLNSQILVEVMQGSTMLIVGSWGKNVTIPLGRGSTGRTEPNNLKEQLAMDAVMSDPLAGKERKLKNGMSDARWPASDGWQKWTQNVNGVEVHYVYNPTTGQFDDFKFP